MEEIETIIYQQKKNKHHFYCDKCDEYLGNTEEYDDGYYPKLGEFELSFNIYGNWYKVKKCFCSKCKIEYMERLGDVLKGVDFEKDV